MIVYDMVMNVLDTKWFPQHNITGLISGITFIVLSGEASTVEGNLQQSEFHFTWTHVNINNEVTLHRSEILTRSEISNQFEFTSGLV